MEEVSWALKYWLEVMSYVLLKICTVPLAMYTENRQTLSPTSENKRKLIIILISWPFISYLPLKYTVCLSQSTNIKKKQTDVFQTSVWLCLSIYFERQETASSMKYYVIVSIEGHHQTTSISIIIIIITIIYYLFVLVVVVVFCCVFFFLSFPFFFFFFWLCISYNRRPDTKLSLKNSTFIHIEREGRKLRMGGKDQN